MSILSIKASDNNLILTVDANPTVSGAAAPLGAFAIFGSSIFVKSGPLDTDWTNIGGGGGGSAWQIVGNSGPGNVLGTITNDGFSFIANNVSVAGFLATGQFYLNTTNASGAEFLSQTATVTTPDATPTNIFAVNMVDSTTGLITVKVQGRSADGLQHCAFERKVMVYSELGVATVSPLVHAIFTDKSNNGLDVKFQAAGETINIQVTGLSSQSVKWSGVCEYQSTGV